ncbi:hypothetical protein [Streptomyces sp. NPDC047981]|uniref:hypothetical protein n=1 Tax=Streptomyces sp. NPDC047981 TaxID=3154610 RepID=UPI003440A662
MTTLYTAPIGTGRRRLAEPRFEESVPRPPVPAPAPPHLADPPIYRAMLHQWASNGRTLPGRADQEWNRLTAAPVWADRTVRVSGVSGTLVSGTPGRPGGAR